MEQRDLVVVVVDRQDASLAVAAGHDDLAVLPGLEKRTVSPTISQTMSPTMSPSPSLTVSPTTGPTIPPTISSTVSPTISPTPPAPPTKKQNQKKSPTSDCSTTQHSALSMQQTSTLSFFFVSVCFLANAKQHARHVWGGIAPRDPRENLIVMSPRPGYLTTATVLSIEYCRVMTPAISIPSSPSRSKSRTLQT